MENSLLHVTDKGLYCPPGDFFIDPWTPVERAVITHAHADHACLGCTSYLTSAPGEALLRQRLGADIQVQPLAYGSSITLRQVKLSLHPAGHILGSAQVRLEHQGQVWVASGDYKIAADPTCTTFEPVRCHGFLTESTFGLPIYRWPDPTEVLNDINSWWGANQQAGKASVLYGYALGKAQRLLAGVDSALGPIYTHGAVEKMNQVYRAADVTLPETTPVSAAAAGTDWSQALIMAPPSAHGSPWTRRFGSFSSGLASGWMRIRGTRRRRAIDRGFVLSDHADWPGLREVIRQTGAEKIWVTHGYVAPLVRWLREQGLDALGVQTRYEGEQDEPQREDNQDHS